MEEEKLNTYIQSVIFIDTPQSKWNAGKASKWLKKNNLIPLQKVVKEKTNRGLSFRYMVNEPSIFKKFITKNTNTGVSIIIGFLE